MIPLAREKWEVKGGLAAESPGLPAAIALNKANRHD
jgi:hypothetical protein